MKNPTVTINPPEQASNHKNKVSDFPINVRKKRIYSMKLKNKNARPDISPLESDLKTSKKTNLILETFLGETEIDELERYYPIFEREKYENYSVCKYELIVDTLKQALHVIKQNERNSFIKLFDWTISQIKQNLNIKPDAEAFKNIEEIKKNTTEEGKFSWLKKYSSLENEMEIYEIADRTGVFESKQTNDIASSSNINHYKAVLNNSGLELDESLLNFASKDFNIFKLQEVIGPDNTLQMVSAFIFTSSNYFQLINSFNFENFVSTIASGYRDNPYHSSLHAADITQTTFVIALNSNFQNELKLTNIDMISLYLSCIVHDYKHPGLTNNYLITAKDKIAINYNDKSVLESFHVAETFKLINSEDKYNIFEGVSDDNYKIIRKRMIENVLATDMTCHQGHLIFINQLSKSKKNLGKIIDELEGSNKFETQQKMMSLLVHASDISNPTKPTEIYKIWAQRVVDEFFLQGDLELKENKKISFLCDRRTTSLSQSQLGFMEGVVKPYFTPICETLKGVNFLMQNLEANIDYFKKLKKEEQLKQESEKEIKKED